MHQCKQSTLVSTGRLPEDKPLVSKNAEDIKMKN